MLHAPTNSILHLVARALTTQSGERIKFIQQVLCKGDGTFIEGDQLSSPFNGTPERGQASNPHSAALQKAYFNVSKALFKHDSRKRHRRHWLIEGTEGTQAR